MAHQDFLDTAAANRAAHEKKTKQKLPWERINDIHRNGAEETLYGKAAAAIADNCAGSGFDSEWYFLDGKKTIKAYTGWQLMNDAGYYIGNYGFTVTIQKKDITDFTMRSTGHNKRTLENYGVWDYLEDTIAMVLDDLNAAMAKKEAQGV
jgi:hypothetical protein